MIPQEDFLHIVKYGVLISFDFLVINDGKLLLGKRLNNPAKGFYFVPGGIYRHSDENIPSAIARLSENELGRALKLEELRFNGVYDHSYENNSFNDDFGTKYIVIGLEYHGDLGITGDDPGGQHEGYVWMDLAEVMSSPSVHENVKRYFKKDDTAIRGA